MNMYGGEVTPVGKVEWDEFKRHLTVGVDRWQQGEHVALIGPTGCGKTSIAHTLLDMRTAVCVIATKPESESLRRFAADNDYKIIREWGKRPRYSRHDKRTHKMLLWPKMAALHDKAGQQRAIYDALSDIFTTGAWAVYVDELKYVHQNLGLGKVIDLYLLQGRELGISLMVATQRPAWIPLEVYDQSTHIFLWNERDERNLDRISGLASLDSRVIRATITGLAKHEFLYINTRTAHMMVSKAPKPGGG